MVDIIEAVKGRKSIRGYRPDPVPKEIIEEILRSATKSPSAMNTQPWEFTVITGEVIENIRRENVESLLSGTAPSSDFALESFGGIYKQRQVNLAVELFKLMGIAREDTVKRSEWMQRGFRYFDAPAAIIVSVDKSVNGSFWIFDLGAVSQTVCLAALKYGLGTCIEAQGVMFPEVIRKYTGIPESKKIIMSIALGYPDENFPTNKLESARVPVENITAWHGFKG
ncbi:MAG: nitroreductase [Bacillota bacterium]